MNIVSSTAMEFIIKTVLDEKEKRQMGRHTDTQKDNGRSLNYSAATLAVSFSSQTLDLLALTLLTSRNQRLCKHSNRH